jgi:hypothetical protein
VFASAIGALSDKLDSKFLTAYWLPAFVAVLANVILFGVLIGWSRLDDWASGLGSVAQTLAALILLLAITMLAFVFRALSHIILAFFAGEALPRRLAEWSARGQMRARNAALRLLGSAPDRSDGLPSVQQVAQAIKQRFPHDAAALQPTLFGNVLATASEYPRLAYAMDGLLWWPRLSPLVAPEAQDALSAAQSPMMALLNLSIVFVAFAIEAAIVWGLIGGMWAAAVVAVIVALLAGRLCYLAAAGQAGEVGSQIRVAFDLYRHEILRQLDLEVPTDLAAERALWQSLTHQMLGQPTSAPPAETGSDAAQTDAAPDAAQVGAAGTARSSS